MKELLPSNRLGPGLRFSVLGEVTGDTNHRKVREKGSSVYKPGPRHSRTLKHLS